MKKMVLGGTLLSAVGFSGKANFLESVSVHLDIFYMNNFRLALIVCNVHVVIFIKTYLVNLFRISFCELLTLVALDCRNYIKPWGGQICPKSEIWLKPFFF